MDDPRDDVQFQVLEHLRALREEMRAMASRMERLEANLLGHANPSAPGRVGATTRPKKTDPAET